LAHLQFTPLLSKRCVANVLNQSGPFKVEHPGGFPPDEVCPGACKPSGEWTKKATNGACNVVQPTPGFVHYPELLEHVRNSITHQGVDIWGNSNESAKGEHLRELLMMGQHRPQQDRGI
jgi:hypothetical protein